MGLYPNHTDLKAKSWLEFLRLLDDLGWTPARRSTIFFRGQADASWALCSSLLRLLPDGMRRPLAVGIEHGARSRFQSEAHLHLRDQLPRESKWSTVDWWMLMQHYSCPTRLLDWTESPFVALYFAAEQLQERDGAVWFFATNWVESHHQLASISVRPDDEEAFTQPNDQRVIFALPPTIQTRRSVAQQGAFTVCTDVLADHGAALQEALRFVAKEHEFYRLVIPAGLKLELLARLRAFNIHAAALFPGADGLGRLSGEYVRFRVWRDHGPTPSSSGGPLSDARVILARAETSPPQRAIDEERMPQDAREAQKVEAIKALLTASFPDAKIHFETWFWSGTRVLSIRSGGSEHRLLFAEEFLEDHSQQEIVKQLETWNVAAQLRERPDQDLLVSEAGPSWMTRRTGQA